MRRYVIALGAMALAIAIALWAVNVRTAKAPGDGQACTTEAKICLDGSAVGRVGPNCEFAPCPEVVATSTTGGGGSGGGSILPYTSGVRGTVLLGPTCPVVRDPPDPGCANRPYATAIAVYRANSASPFIIGNSDIDGTFEFSLPPGSYTLAASSGSTFPRCSEINVTVSPDAYAIAVIFCDTGIR